MTNTIKNDHRPIAAWIKDLQAGNRFCCACGQVNIGKDEESWKRKCITCFMEKSPAKFCRECGDELERDRIVYAKSHGNECQKCRWCNRSSNHKFRPEFNVKAPDHWFESPTPKS